MNRLAYNVVGLLGDATIKASVVCLVALLAMMPRPGTAAVRAFVWTTVVLGCLVIPLATFITPGFRWPLHAPIGHFDLSKSNPLLMSVSTPGGPAGASSSNSSSVRTPTPTASFRSDSDGSSRSIPWQETLAGVWLLGAALLIADTCIGAVSARRLAARAFAAPRSIQAQLHEIVQQLGLRGGVAVRINPSVQTPTLIGCFRPCVVLPTAAIDWSEQQLRATLLHELSHVRRHDLIVQMATQIVCAMYWFDPLLWIVARRLREERERACDDVVLRNHIDGGVYGELLVHVASTLRGPEHSRRLAMAMARPCGLRTRLAAVLDPATDRKPISRLGRTGIIVAGILVIGLIAPFKVIADESPASTSSRSPATRPDATSQSIENAASLCRSAEDIIRANDAKDICCPSTSNMMYPPNPPFSREWKDREAAAYTADAPAFALVRQASNLSSKASWPPDVEGDSRSQTTAYDGVRDLANELADAALYQSQQGDDAAAFRTLHDLWKLADSVENRTHQRYIALLVGSGIRAMTVFRMEIVASTLHLTRDPATSQNVSVETVRQWIDRLLEIKPAQATLDQALGGDTDRAKIQRLDLALETLRRVQAECGMAAISLACHLYRFGHGTWPPSLATLHDYLPQVPIDPLGDGQALLGYTVVKGGLPNGLDRPLVYSRDQVAESALFFPTDQPEYSWYDLTHRNGGQFRDIVSWSGKAPAEEPAAFRPLHE